LLGKSSGCPDTGLLSCWRVDGLFLYALCVDRAHFPSHSVVIGDGAVAVFIGEGLRGRPVIGGHSLLPFFIYRRGFSSIYVVGVAHAASICKGFADDISLLIVVVLRGVSFAVRIFYEVSFVIIGTGADIAACIGFLNEISRLIVFVFYRISGSIGFLYKIVSVVIYPLIAAFTGFTAFRPHPLIEGIRPVVTIGVFDPGLGLVIGKL